jgi:polyhydroxybutyrate depolymerase
MLTPAFIRLLRVWFTLTATVAFTGAAELQRREWSVAGETRVALVHVPEKFPATGAPLVFVFHGHGGNMQQAAKSQPFHQVWPEAVVVFMQGLPTPGRLTDPEGKRNGWQMGPGIEGDRDLKFFDAVLASLRTEQAIDAKRIYVTGHSNGGGFTYLLWAKRGEVFAAFGPSSALAHPSYGALAPRPVIHVTGEHDPLVKFEWQKAMIESLRRTNQCGEGQPAGAGKTLYSSKLDAPVMTYIHSGGHEYAKEAPAIIALFFKEHPKR